MSDKHTTVRARRRWGTHLVLLIGGLLMVFPFVWQLNMSLSTQAEVTSVPPTWFPTEPQWGNYPAVFEQVPFWNQFLNTAAVTIARVLGQLLLCALAGYAFARMTFRGKNVLFALVLSILMVPYQIYLIPQYDIVQQLGWLNTVAGIAAPGIFSAFGTFLMRQHFMGMPRSLEEAARLDGANPWQTFWRIMFPLSGPALSGRDPHRPRLLERPDVAADRRDLRRPHHPRGGAVQPPGPVHHRLPGDDGGELHGDAAADDPVHRAAAPRDRGARPLGHEGLTGPLTASAHLRGGGTDHPTDYYHP